MDIDNGYTTAKEFFDKKLQELEEKLQESEEKLKVYQMKHSWVQKLWCKVCNKCRVIQTENNKDDECK